MSECPFCQIADHEIDTYRVYEDEETVAFLDVNPVSKGHLLVIPKQHKKQLTGLDRKTTDALFNTVRKMTDALQDSMNPDGVNVLQNNGEGAGQEVGHVHVHVIPRYSHDGFDLEFDSDELDDDTAEHLVDMIG
jgi:histidine triad (HIT) family protein